MAGKRIISTATECRWDIHIHSRYSADSRSKVGDIIRVAKMKGLDGIAITDHGSLGGYFEGKPLAKKYGLGLVAGYEYKSADGDLLVLGLPRMPKTTKLPAADVVDFAHRLGGVVIAAHPFDPFRAGVGRRLLHDELNVDAIETINSHCLIYGNFKAARVASNIGRPQVGGSDAHTAAEVGNAFTVFSGGKGDILNAIKSGRTHSAGGINVPTLHEAIATNVLTIPARLRELILGKEGEI